MNINEFEKRMKNIEINLSWENILTGSSIILILILHLLGMRKSDFWIFTSVVYITLIYFIYLFVQSIKMVINGYRNSEKWYKTLLSFEFFFGMFYFYTAGLQIILVANSYIERNRTIGAYGILIAIIYSLRISQKLIYYSNSKDDRYKLVIPMLLIVIMSGVIMINNRLGDNYLPYSYLACGIILLLDSFINGDIKKRVGIGRRIEKLPAITSFILTMILITGAGYIEYHNLTKIRTRIIRFFF